MTLRAGSYDASRPRYRGVIRHDSFAYYVCVHDHPDKDSSKVCSVKALAEIRAADPEDRGLGHGQLPEGWWPYFREYHSGL